MTSSTAIETTVCFTPARASRVVPGNKLLLAEHLVVVTEVRVASDGLQIFYRIIGDLDTRDPESPDNIGPRTLPLTTAVAHVVPEIFLPKLYMHRIVYLREEAS